MKVLGLSCGRRNGNTEIMVKEGLMGAEEAGAEVMFVRLHDYFLKPCTGCNRCVVDLMENGGSGKCVIKDDDFEEIDELFMECDGFIVGTPIYAKGTTGQYKVLQDRMGPSHDQAMRMMAMKKREEMGITAGTGPDPRSLRRRAAALIAVGGSEWDQLALPTMGISCLTMQIDVVDQIRVNWVALPRTVVLHDEYLARVHRAGRRVVEHLRKGEDEPVEYLGSKGVCPMCHSNLIEIRHDDEVYPCVCGLCGVRGTLSIERGKVKFSVSDDDRPLSHLLLSGKFNHMRELDEICLRPSKGHETIPDRAAKYKDYLSPVKPSRRQRSQEVDRTEEAAYDAAS